jgi:hypothetical protein
MESLESVAQNGNPIDIFIWSSMPARRLSPDIKRLFHSYRNVSCRVSHTDDFSDLLPATLTIGDRQYWQATDAFSCDLQAGKDIQSPTSPAAIEVPAQVTFNDPMGTLRQTAFFYSFFHRATPAGYLN